MRSLIASGKCTLVDLKERLTLEDAYIIAEAISVERHNENVAQAIAWEKAERKR